MRSPSLLLASLLLLTASAVAQRHRRHAPRPSPAAAAPGDVPSPTQPLETPGFALRPIDRATVRLIAVRGLSGRFVRGRSGALRLVADANASYGSGVVVSRDGVIVTARHVVAGADVLAVVFPGQRVAVPATVLYSDVAHDIAFLTVPVTRPIADIVALPTEVPTLTSGQRLLVSGYPLDPEERYPAAVAGEFARINNDGRLQLSISVNHGNSGGPVVDEAGRLVGVVSMRGEPERGVEGLSLVEPIRTVLEPWGREVRALERPTFRPEDARVAQAAYDLLRLNPEREPRDPASADRVLALAGAILSPEATSIVGAQAWNEALVLLESQRAATVAALPADARPRADALLGVATNLQLRALRAAPYLRTNYPFLHWFSRIRGNVVAPPPAPIRDREDDAGEAADAVGAASSPDAPSPPEVQGPVEGKVATFLERQLRVQGPLPPTTRGEVTVTVRINASGIVQAAALRQGTGNVTVDDALSARLRALVERHPRVESLTSGEVTALADRDLQVRLRLQR